MVLVLNIFTGIGHHIGPRHKYNIALAVAIDIIIGNGHCIEREKADCITSGKIPKLGMTRFTSSSWQP